ncbi:MAG: MEDS domain-containing protein, partial [Thermoanaerobaculia bacterium]
MIRSQSVPGAIELGIRGQYAHPGDHIAYFWMDESEFREGVRFLEVGLEQGDYCVVFGYEEANRRVLDVLDPKFDFQELQNESRLSVIHGVSSAAAMLGQIGADFEGALGRGAKRLRLLGNIGWG